jgi:hypothetical protein
LEISSEGTNALFLSVDEDRNLTLEKLVERADRAKLLESRRKVIVAGDPSIATTIPIPLELSREHANAKTKLTIAELENLIAQAMAKIFIGCRSEAAKRFGVNDLDAVMVGAKTKHFTIDGKAVASPVGFMGKKISLLLELTFTTRELFQDLKPFFNSPDHFFFAEGPQAELAALAEVRALPLNLIAARKDGASLYALQKAKGEYAVLYREVFNWSFAGLFRAMAKELAVSEAVAKELYRAYHKKDMSETALRAVKKMLQPAVDDLLREIKRLNISGFVYSDASHVLPLDLPHRHGAAKLEEHPIGELLMKFGFTADAETLREEGNDVLRPLLYFLEAYFDKSNSEINQKLRRRLHWLAE